MLLLMIHTSATTNIVTNDINISDEKCRCGRYTLLATTFIVTYDIHISDDTYTPTTTNFVANDSHQRRHLSSLMIHTSSNDKCGLWWRAHLQWLYNHQRRHWSSLMIVVVNINCFYFWLINVLNCLVWII